MSIKRLCVRISNCSRLSLYLWGERRIVTISFSVGRGIGPLVNDLLGTLVDQVVLVGLELDADLLICHIISFLLFVSGSTRSRVFHL